MNARKRQSLWDLLGHASPVLASPDFAARVTARARALPQHRHPAFLLTLAGVAAAVAVLAIGASVLLLPSAPCVAQLRPGQDHETLTEEFETIVLMDELLAVNDPAQLDDEGLAKLLFR